MVLETRPDLRVAALGNAQDMLASPLGLAFLFLKFYELFCLCVANGTFCGRVFTFIYITAYEASEFLFHLGYLFNVLLWKNSNLNSIYKNNENFTNNH
jgi:hypothetical protein